MEFRVMSGSEVLWSSGVMKRGMPAKKFSVPVAENGIRHLYLMADRVENNSYDHADWVDLVWKTGGEPQGMKGAVVNAAKFGMIPGVRKRPGAGAEGSRFRSPKAGRRRFEHPRGRLPFLSGGALNMSFNISNHDQPLVHPVCVTLTDLRNVRVEGNGSLFLFHGKVVPLLVMDSENVSINRLSVDYERSYCTEARVLNADDRSTEVEIDKKAYPYEIRNNRFVFQGKAGKKEWEAAWPLRKGRDILSPIHRTSAGTGMWSRWAGAVSVCPGTSGRRESSRGIRWFFGIITAPIRDAWCTGLGKHH
ncbi:MAG: NPCBM/NEW2 domain-containing protein [Akkermansia sp.]